ncbi:MAG: DUF2807 domain-containing protein [Alistipes sp.]|nr:DUF2807 domain-containing protein [Alistipes sp.]
MKRFFYFLVAATLIISNITSAQAQDRSSKGTIIINGKELDIDKYAEIIENAAETIEDAVEQAAEAIEKDANIKINGRGDQRLRGSGNIITESRIVPADYHTVVTSRAIKVTLENREGTTAIIRADDNVMPHIKIENKNGVLKIKIDDEIRSINSMTAEVRLPKSTNISRLEATSASHIDVDYTIQSAKLYAEASSAADINISKADVTNCIIDASSAAKITGSIKATECNINAISAANAKVQILANTCYADASSAADITLAGEAGTLYLKASSAADINALNAKALVSTSADASSGANIKVNAGKALTADASSGGTVAYKSDHDVNIHIKKSSGGSVRKM